MDPHLRTVRNWDKNYLPDEREAYHESRINGYIFPQLGSDDTIGILDRDELENIASHPPSVNLRRYKYYRSMEMEDLMKEFPEVVFIIGSGVTYEDLFYYATRGWIPEYDSIDLKIERYNQYNDLSEVGQDLMNRIYGNAYNFINSNPHPLESTIIAYDQNMDDESAIRAIADRIGIVLPDGPYAHDSFYEILVSSI